MQLPDKGNQSRFDLIESIAKEIASRFWIQLVPSGSLAFQGTAAVPRPGPHPRNIPARTRLAPVVVPGRSGGAVGLASRLLFITVKSCCSAAMQR